MDSFKPSYGGPRTGGKTGPIGSKGAPNFANSRRNFANSARNFANSALDLPVWRWFFSSKKSLMVRQLPP